MKMYTLNYFLISAIELSFHCGKYAQVSYVHIKTFIPCFSYFQEISLYLFNEFFRVFKKIQDALLN